MMRASKGGGATARGTQNLENEIDVHRSRGSSKGPSEPNHKQRFGGQKRNPLVPIASPASTVLGSSSNGPFSTPPRLTPADTPLGPAVVMFAQQADRDAAVTLSTSTKQPSTNPSVLSSGKEGNIQPLQQPLDEEESEKAKAAMFAAQVQVAIEQHDDPALELSYCDWDENDVISDDGRGGEEKAKSRGGGGDIDVSYYPDPQEIMMLPEVLQQYILRRARLVLSRFVFMFRLRKAIRNRHKQHNAPVQEGAPPTALPQEIGRAHV